METVVTLPFAPETVQRIILIGGLVSGTAVVIGLLKLLSMPWPGQRPDTTPQFDVAARPGHTSDSTPEPNATKRPLQETLGLGALPKGAFLLCVAFWCLLAGLLFLGLMNLVLEIGWHWVTPEGPTPGQMLLRALGGAVPDTKWDFRFSLAKVTALTAVLGAMIALPVTLNWLRLTREQTETAREALTADRLGKAIEALGSASETVRLGAMHILLAIASTDKTAIAPVNAIFESHIRQLARAVHTEDFNDPFVEPGSSCHQPDYKGKSSAELRARELALKEWLEGLPVPSDELQTAVTHWGSLPRIAKHRTDFSDCDFRGIKFMNCDLTSVNFRRTKMDKAEFYDSTLVSVIARGNDWQEAFNSEDEPEFKVNRGCTMRGAAFLNCTIHDCEFIGAEMEHCVFTRGTLKRTAFAGCGLRFSQFVKVPAKNLLFYRTNLMHSSAVDGCNFQNIDIHGSSHIRGLPADETIRHQEIAFGQFYSQTRMNWSARF